MRYQEDDDEYVTSPMTQLSRPSTMSSVGSIPDFPIPMMPPPPAAAGPRKSANLGPPPSARRGVSSYYSQPSYVSPIPEESLRSPPSRGSYASSAAIPSIWGTESLGSVYDDRYDDRGFGHDTIEEGRESRESNINDNDDAELIRSASLGKRAKPSMVTTKSTDKLDTLQLAPAPQQKSKLERMGVVTAATVATQAAMTAPRSDQGQQESFWPMKKTDSPLAGGTGFIDKSSSSSDNESPTVARAVTTDDRSPMPVPSSKGTEPQAKNMLGAYNAASSLQPGGSNTRLELRVLGSVDYQPYEDHHGWISMLFALQRQEVA